MGFFNKNQDTDDRKQTPRNPSNVATFRLIAVFYVGYLCINMIKLYIEGGPDAPSLTALLVGLIVLGGGAAFLAFLTYKEWKRGKVVYDQAMAELRAEAEAKRAEEEAALTTQEEEDCCCEALESGETEE